MKLLLAMWYGMLLQIVVFAVSSDFWVSALVGGTGGFIFFLLFRPDKNV